MRHYLIFDLRAGSSLVFLFMRHCLTLDFRRDLNVLFILSMYSSALV